MCGFACASARCCCRVSPVTLLPCGVTAATTHSTLERQPRASFGFSAFRADSQIELDPCAWPVAEEEHALCGCRCSKTASSYRLRVRHSIELQRCRLLSRPTTASTCCYRKAPRWPEVVCFGLLIKKKMVCCVLVFCQFIINHCVCCKHTTVQIGNAHEYTVRRRICCLSRASGVVVVVSWPSMVSMGFRLVRALGCSAAVAFGCVCLSHVAGWLTSVEVFAVVPLGVSCFLSCRVR